MAKASELIPGAQFGHLTSRDPSSYTIQRAIDDAVTIVEKRTVWVSKGSFSSYAGTIDGWVVDGGEHGSRNGLTPFYATKEAVTDRKASSVGFVVLTGAGWVSLDTLKAMLATAKAKEQAADERRNRIRAKDAETSRRSLEVASALGVAGYDVRAGENGSMTLSESAITALLSRLNAEVAP